MAETNPTFRDLLQSSTEAILANKNNRLEEHSASTAQLFVVDYSDLLARQTDDETGIRMSNVLAGTRFENYSKVPPQFALLAVALASVEIYMESIGIVRE